MTWLSMRYTKTEELENWQQKFWCWVANPHGLPTGFVPFHYSEIRWHTDLVDLIQIKPYFMSAVYKQVSSLHNLTRQSDFPVQDIENDNEPNGSATYTPGFWENFNYREIGRKARIHLKLDNLTWRRIVEDLPLLKPESPFFIQHIELSGARL